MTNKIIRIAMIEHNLKQWELAELLGIDETVLCRKLRKELPEAEQHKIVSIIEEAEQK